MARARRASSRRTAAASAAPAAAAPANDDGAAEPATPPAAVSKRRSSRKQATGPPPPPTPPPGAKTPAPPRRGRSYASAVKKGKEPAAKRARRSRKAVNYDDDAEDSDDADDDFEEAEPEKAEEAEEEEEEPKAKRARKAPAKKTPAKKTPAKKTPAKKTPAKKTPAKKTPAKKTPAKKTPAKKTPAKKAPAKKTPAKKAPAKKAGKLTAEEREAAKAAKAAEREAAKAAKLKEREAAKAAKLKAREEARAAKLKAREEAKAAKALARQQEREEKARRKKYGPALQSLDVPEATAASKSHKHDTSCCVRCSSKEAFRAAAHNDKALLKSVLGDLKHVCDPLIQWSADVEETAAVRAVKLGHWPVVTAYLEWQKKKEDTSKNGLATDEAKRVSATTSSLGQNKGQQSFYTYGVRTRNVGTGRGGREGNNAFVGDEDEGSRHRYYRYGHSAMTPVHRAIVQHADPDDAATATLLAQLMDEDSFVTYLGCFGLYDAAQAGNGPMVRKIAAKLQDRGGWGMNFLFAQVMRTDGGALDRFTKPQVKKKAQENYAITPIHVSTLNADVQYLRTLLEKDAETLAVLDKSGRAPVHYAAVSRTNAALAYLAERGCNLLARDRTKTTPLHMAARAGAAHNVELLVKGDLADTVNTTDKSGVPALVMAAQRGHADFVRALKTHAGEHADMNVLVKKNKTTPVMHAAKAGHVETVRALVESGANAHLCDKLKRNALHYAAKNGHMEVVRYLLHIGLPGDAVDTSNNSVLHYAAAYGWHDIVRVLVEFGVKSDAKNDWNLTPMVVASKKGHMRIVDYFMELTGVSINFRDETGRTMVHNFLANKSDSSVSNSFFLIEQSGADVSIKDLEDNTVLHCLASGSVHADDVRMAKLLLRRGVLLDDVNSGGMTAFMTALLRRNYKLAQFFVSKGAHVGLTYGESEGNVLHALFAQAQSVDLTKPLAVLKKASADVLRTMAKQVNRSGYTPLHVLLLAMRGANEGRNYYGWHHRNNNNNNKEEETPTATDAATMVTFIKAYVKTMGVQLDDTVQKHRKKEGESDDAEDAITAANTAVFGRAPRKKLARKRKRGAVMGDINEGDEEKKDAEEEKQNYLGWNMLHFALVLGYSELIEAALKMGIQPRADAYGVTPLHLAVFTNAGKSDSTFAVERRLVALGCDANAVDADGNTPLHCAFAQPRRGMGKYADQWNVVQDPIEMVSDLCSLDNVDIDIANKDGRSPLHFAAQRGATISSMYLLKRGADLEREDKRFNTPLCSALCASKIDYAVTLINAGANVRHALHPGGAAVARKHLHSIFHFVCSKGWNGLAYLMIDMGLDPIDAMRDALASGRLKLVLTLISKATDATVRASNAKNETMMHVAAAYNGDSADALVEIASVLKRRGCALDVADEWGQTPLHVAAHKGAAAMVAFLLDCDVPANGVDMYGSTPLVRAVRRNHERAAMLLLDHGVDVGINVADENGCTVVHHVVQPFANATYENVKLLRALSDAGADVDEEDNDGHTPMFLAQCQARDTMAKALRKLGAALPARAGEVEAPTARPFAAAPLDVAGDAAAEREVQLRAAKARREAKAAEAAAKGGDEEPKAKVDPLAKMDKTGVVLEDGDVVYDVMLNKVDVTYGRYGMNSFYKLQLIHNTMQDIYVLWNRWGRVGEAGQYQQTPMPREAAVKEFEKLFKEKTGNLWSNRAHMVDVPKKYKIVEEGKAEALDELVQPFDLDNAPNSELPPALRSMLTTLTDVQAMKRTMREAGLDTAAMPLGQLSVERLREGYGKLKELQEVHKKLGLDVDYSKRPTLDQKQRDVLNADMVRLSNDFYRIFPSSEFTQSAIRPINTTEVLSKHMNELNLLTDLESASKIMLAAQHRAKEINPLDYTLRALRVHLNEVPRGSEAWRVLVEYMNAGKDGSSHYIRNVWEVEREGEVDAFAPHRALANRALLWHGSSNANYLGILSKGLRIAPPEAPVTGYMFGKGIYFADQYMKSANYCSSPGLIMVCEVARGNMYKIKEAEYMEKPPTGKHSTMGMGRHGPAKKGALYTNDGAEIPCGARTEVARNADDYTLANNEYIVYDESQVRIRYLIQFGTKA